MGEVSLSLIVVVDEPKSHRIACTRSFQKINLLLIIEIRVASSNRAILSGVRSQVRILVTFYYVLDPLESFGVAANYLTVTRIREIAKVVKILLISTQAYLVSMISKEEEILYVKYES